MATGTDRDLLSGPNRCVSSPVFRQEISGPLSLVGNSNADIFATKIFEHDDEYKDLFKTVTKDLEKAGQKLIQIEQITNRLQKSRFQMEIDRLKCSKPSKDFQLNVRSLYHGTTAPVEQICYEGLDERLSRKGRFGKGIYFSDNPEKCCKYAARTDGLCFLLRCRVILGDIKEYPDGQHDRKNCREPLKENLNGRNIYYDSVKGKPRDHVEYVIYDKRRALIDYVIYYQSANSDSSDTPVKFDVSADKNGGAEAESGEESERCSGSATPTSTGGAGSGEESGDESDDSTSSTDQPDNTAISENKEKIFPSRNKTDAAKLCLRVVRGKDWKWSNQDGGEGFVGTLVKVEGSAGQRKVVVTWDGGLKANYRAGLEGADDLRVLDNAVAGVQHPNVNCDACNTSGIHGIRWKCTTCHDYDLCHSCYMTNKHELQHTFYRFDTSMSQGILVAARHNAKRVQSKGIFVGAKVERGVNWSSTYGNQDGGVGTKGDVTGIINAKSSSGTTWGSCVQVTWPNGNKNNYRRGLDGQMEVKCVQPRSGYNYYVDHLPLLSQYEYNIFEKGDYLKLKDSAMTLSEKQQMSQHLNKIGVVNATEVGDTKILVVKFDSQSVYSISNLHYISKVRRFKKGDTVKILAEKEKVKQLQNGHGGWIELMSQTLGKSGKVISVDSDGDVRVAFNDGTKWTYGPTCCTLVQASQEVDDDDDDDDIADPLAQLLQGLLFMQGLQTKAVEEVTPDKLCEEAYKGNVQKVRAILQKYPGEVDRKFKHKTALQIASHQGHTQVVQALLEKGANPGEKDDEGDTAYHFAIFGQKPEILRMLLQKKNSDVNARNNKGQSALQVAVVNQLKDCVDALLVHNADVNVVDKDGDPPIHEAIYRSNADILQALIDCSRCDYRIKNNAGQNALHFAVCRKKPIALDKLLKAAPNLVNIEMTNGSTALHAAAEEGSRRIVEQLINTGRVNMDMQDRENCSTPLHLAVLKGHAAVVELLAKKGASVNIEDEDGDTPLNLIFCNIIPSLQYELNDLSPVEPTDLSEANEIGKIEKLLPASIKENRVWIAMGCYLISRGAELSHANHRGISALNVISDQIIKTALLKYDKNTSSGTPVSQTSTTSRTNQSTTQAPQSNGSAQKCIKCKNNKPEVLFRPCGHAVVCSTCRKGLKNCPSCQSEIQEVLKISIQQPPDESLTRNRNGNTSKENPVAEDVKPQQKPDPPKKPEAKSQAPSNLGASKPTPPVPQKSAEVKPAEETKASVSGPSVQSVMCTKCSLNPRNVMFMPCGHGCCANCSQTLTTCHSCGGDIFNKLQLY